MKVVVIIASALFLGAWCGQTLAQKSISSIGDSLQFAACEPTAAEQCQKGVEACQRTCEVSAIGRNSAAAIVACKQNCMNSYSTCMTRARC